MARLPAETIATFLGQTPLLKNCELDLLFDLAQAAEQSSYSQGEVILKPGRPTSQLGLLHRGRASLRLVNAATGTQKQLEQLLPGDPFGEVGMLLGTANPLSVVAEEDCTAILMSGPALERALKKTPELSLILAKRISSRFIQVSMLGLSASPAIAVKEVEKKAPEPARPQPQKQSVEPQKGQMLFVECSMYEITEKLVQMIPTDLMHQHRMIPLKLDGQKLHVGMVNPNSLQAIRDLRRVLHSVDPVPFAISSDDFAQTFMRLGIDRNAAKADRRRGATRYEKIIYEVEQERGDGKKKGQIVIGEEVIVLLDKIFLEALDMRASDIHIEPESNGVRVRYRVSGTLIERSEYVSASFATPLIARIKVLAELDITERRLPQDGRILAQIGKNELNLRVSTMAVARGEKAVLRIIDPSDIMRPLHRIFLNPNVSEGVRRTLSNPYGAIVVAGPTGSGKSCTLYSMLNERKSTRPDTNIVTVEDPVEYMLKGVTQVPVNPKVGLEFSNVLRGLMRQDPDVIMIGELRDSETAQIMVEAALTGHLALTSTHANDATAVIQRLQHLGSDEVLLSQALSLIVVQRLARRLCPSCTKEEEVSPAMKESLAARRIIKSASGPLSLPRSIGCQSCNGEGYIGRVAVQELLWIDGRVRIALASGAKPKELLGVAAEAGCFNSFAQSAAYLMARRQITPADALLVVAG